MSRNHVANSGCLSANFTQTVVDIGHQQQLIKAIVEGTGVHMVSQLSALLMCLNQGISHQNVSQATQTPTPQCLHGHNHSDGVITLITFGRRVVSEIT